MKFEIDLSPALVRGLERMRETTEYKTVDEIVEAYLSWIKDYEPIDEAEYMLVDEWAKREGLEPSGIRRRAREDKIPCKRDEKGRIWISKELTKETMPDGRRTRWQKEKGMSE